MHALRGEDFVHNTARPRLGRHRATRPLSNAYQNFESPGWIVPSFDEYFIHRMRTGKCLGYPWENTLAAVIWAHEKAD
jgi:hypothetical protein